MHVLWSLIVGLVIGALAKLFMPGKDPGGLVVTMLLGVAGSLVAGFVGRSLGWYSSATNGAGIIASIIGAMALLGIYRLVIEPETSDRGLTRSGNSEANSAGRATPRSVMMAVTKRAGVTSNPGLWVGLPVGISLIVAVASPAAVRPVVSKPDIVRDLVAAALLDRDLVRAVASASSRSSGDGTAT